MPSSCFPRAAALALALVLSGAVGAHAQTYDGAGRRVSPYSLPQPIDREPDAGDILNGNGELHASGQWRHWGDDRNEGETFKEIFAPSGVLGGGESPRYSAYARRERYCNFHPGTC